MDLYEFTVCIPQTVVSENVDLVLHKNLSSLNSFTADMKKRGLESYSRVILREEGKASPKEALILNLNEGEFVHRLNRVRYLVNEPLLYEIAVIPASIISISSLILIIECRAFLSSRLRPSYIITTRCPGLAVLN